MFVTERLLDVTGKVPFYKLLKNGKCQFEDFIEGLERAGNMNTEVQGVFSIMNRIANGFDVPLSMFKQLEGNEKIKDYEIRKNGIRIYLAKYLTGYLIVIGGLKPNQKKDIPKMRVLKNSFFTSI